jgi:hypothetical protein
MTELGCIGCANGNDLPEGEKCAMCGNVKMTKEERETMQLIKERDSFEDALSQAYYLITGRSPEWSNVFGVDEALEEIHETQYLLREMAKKPLEQIKNRIDIRLNDHLAGMKPECDDSICGFNEAWGIVSELFRECLAPRIEVTKCCNDPNNLEMGYGLAGGGISVYQYCKDCGKIISKTQDVP